MRNWLSLRYWLLLVLCCSLGSHNVQEAPVVSAAVPTVPDAWSPPITWRTPDGFYASSIHATLMPNGTVHMIGLARPQNPPTPSMMSRPSAFVMDPLPLGAAFPSSLVPTYWTEPVAVRNWVMGSFRVNDDLYCAGHTLTSDGQLFTVGGTRWVKNLENGNDLFMGLPYATLFDSEHWTRVAAEMKAGLPNTEALRWYPTVTRLPNNRLMVTGGFHSVTNPVANVSVETYDLTSGEWTIHSPWNTPPYEILNSDYTHAFVLPDPLGPVDVMMFGEPGIPVFTTSSEAAPLWMPRGENPRPGSEAFQQARIAKGGSWDPLVAPNNSASSVMLPLRVNNGEFGYANGSVLIAGGPVASPYSDRLDIYDPMFNHWWTPIATGAQRSYPATVLLPDGRVLMLNGQGGDPDARHAGYLDTQGGFTVSLGASDGGEIRGYHAVAVLLPDGRVLVGGGRGITKNGTLEQPTFRYYHPHYIFANRPSIVSAPETIGFGQSFSVQAAGSNPPKEVVLISLASMTHSFDMNQRSVQLAVTANTPAGQPGQYGLTVVGPPDAHDAPAGYYMLFVVDDQRIPSVAKIVRLQ